MKKRVETNLYKEKAIEGKFEHAEEKLEEEIKESRPKFGISTTESSVADKVVTCEDFLLYEGAIVNVKFTTQNTATAPTLNVNNTGAKVIQAKDNAISPDSPFSWKAGAIIEFVFDGTYWQMVNTNAQDFVGYYDQYLDQAEVFKKLTNNGQAQGIFLDEDTGDIYINMTYLQGGIGKFGGVNNKDGVIEIYNQAGNRIIRLDNTGQYIGNIESSLLEPKIKFLADSGEINGVNINGTYITGGNIHNEDVSQPYQRSDFDINEATATSKDTIYSDEERTTVIQEYKSIQRHGQFINDYIHYDEEGNIDDWTRGRMGGGAIELTELNADEELIGGLQLSITLYNMQYPRLSYAWRLPSGVLKHIDYFPAFRPEESVRFGVGPYAGHVTNAGKDLVFWIPYFKNADGMIVDTITLPTTLTVRGTQGYLNSGSISGSALEVASFDNRMGGLQVTLRQKNGNAFTNVTNNTPVSVVFRSGYLTATYKLYEN